MLKNQLSPEGDAGGGEGDDDQHQGGEGGEGGQEEGGGEGEDKKGEEGEGEGKPKPTGLTKDDITDILSRVIPAGEQRGGAREEQTKQYTQAEIEQLLNVWKPDASFLKKLGFPEPTAEQLAAVHEMRDHLIRQANTMSEARVQQLLGEYKSQLEELSTYVSEQRAQAATNSFFSQYSELKPYEEIVEAVSAKLEASGFKAPTQAKVFEEIAKNTTEVLKRMNVKIEKKSGGGAGTGGNGQSRMSRLTGGGQGGGGESGKGDKKRPGMEIFDEKE